MHETAEVAKRCTFSLEELRYGYREEVVPAGQTPASHLPALTFASAATGFLDLDERSASMDEYSRYVRPPAFVVPS